MKKDPRDTQFKPGHASYKGTRKGSRNLLCREFIEDLCENWRQNKDTYLRIVGKEDPGLIMKLITTLCPKELEVNTNAIAELTDEQLDIISSILRRSDDLGRDRGGEEPTLN